MIQNIDSIRFGRNILSFIMSLESSFTFSMKKPFHSIFDIKYAIAKFHVKYGLSVKTYKSWDNHVYGVKCVDKEYNIIVFIVANLKIDLIKSN